MVDLIGWSKALENEIAIFAHRHIFYDTPYRTGALARGISDVGALATGTGFHLLTQHTQYGATLNEYPVIQYTATNKRSGKTYSVSYVNKHYGWVNRAAENIANDIPINFPNIERII